MARLFNGFWVIITVALCLVFAVLFFPLAHQRYGILPATLLTSAGVLVIWIVYIVRAYIFSRT